MNTSLFLVSIACEPRIYVSQPDKRQWVHSYEIFASQEEARAFVKFKKEKYQVKSSRVETLNISKIKKIVHYSGNRFLSIDIEGKGGIFNNFKPQIFSCQVRTFSNQEIKTLILQEDSPLIAEYIEIQNQL